MAVLATGKEHVSYSESKDWNECSWRHKLKYINKIKLDPDKPHLDFGQAFHAVAEESVLNRNLTNGKEIALKVLAEAIEKNKDNEFYKDIDIDVWAEKIAAELVPEALALLDKEIPGWTTQNSEEDLYEPITILGESKHNDIRIKGMIDAVLCQVVKGKKIWWLIDWKTANKSWGKAKLMDKNVTSQLAIYKQTWAAKHKIPLSSIRCAFVVVVKDGKPGKRCKFHKVSVGPTTTAKSLKVINNMVWAIKNGIAIKMKNDNTCRFCPYKGTEWCK